MLIAERRWCRRLQARRLDQSRPWALHRLEAFPLQLEPHRRNLASGRMHPCIRDLAQPGSDPRIGGIAIDGESFWAELARQRHIEACAKIADEPFDLAFGLRPIGPAQPRHEPIMVREVEEGAVILMQSWSVMITIGDH